ncbi:MAG: hypothetical protein VCB26_04445, partial [Candidatus Hydrogenedentota bacterium]
ARDVAPYRQDVHKVLGDAYFEVGDFESAKLSYREHIRLGGTDPHAKECLNALDPPKNDLK